MIGIKSIFPASLVAVAAVAAGTFDTRSASAYDNYAYANNGYGGYAPASVSPQGYYSTGTTYVSPSYNSSPSCGPVYTPPPIYCPPQPAYCPPQPVYQPRPVVVYRPAPVYRPVYAAPVYRGPVYVDPRDCGPRDGIRVNLSFGGRF